jgi:hypothetical protein
LLWSFLAIPSVSSPNNRISPDTYISWILVWGISKPRLSPSCYPTTVWRLRLYSEISFYDQGQESFWQEEPYSDSFALVCAPSKHAYDRYTIKSSPTAADAITISGNSADASYIGSISTPATADAIPITGN